MDIKITSIPYQWGHNTVSDTMKLHFDCFGTMTATSLRSSIRNEMDPHTIPNLTEGQIRIFKIILARFINHRYNTGGSGGDHGFGEFLAMFDDIVEELKSNVELQEANKGADKLKTELEKTKKELEETKVKLKKWKTTMTEEEEIQLACIRAKEGAKKRLQELYDARPMISFDLIGETLM